MTVKKDLKIYSVNPFYLIFNKMNGHFEEINGIRYLELVPTNEKIKKYKKKIKKKSINHYGLKSEI